MSDERDKPGLSLDDDELALELDQWDSVFDTLHTADEELIQKVQAGEATPIPDPDPDPVPPAVAPPPARAAAATPSPVDGLGALEDLAEEDLIGEPEALGELLGSPPPLPPVEEGVRVAPEANDDFEEDLDVFTSAARPALSLRAPTLAPAPTDEELFGDLPAEVDFSALAPPVPQRPGTRPGGDGASPIEPTRVADVDLDLLAEAGGEHAPEATRVAGVEMLELAAQARAPEQRGPAIVRRDELERRRAQEEPAEGDWGDGDFSGGESTRIASAAVLQGLVESEAEAAAAASAAAEAFFAEDPPEVQLELDDDFYADIEIGSGAAEATASPALEPVEAEPRRRTTAHVIRRAATAPALPAADEGLVLELEVDADEHFEAAGELPGRGAEATASARSIGSTAADDAGDASVVVDALVSDPDDGVEPVLDLDADLEPVAEAPDVARQEDPAPSSSDDDEDEDDGFGPDIDFEADFELSDLDGGESGFDIEAADAGDEDEVLELGAPKPTPEVVPEDAPVSAIDAGALEADGAAPATPGEPAPAPAVDAAPAGEPIAEPEVRAEVTPAPPRADAAALADAAPAEPEAGAGPADLEVDLFAQGDEELTPDPATSVELAEVDVAPELPPPVYAEVEPTLELAALALPEQVEVAGDDRTEEMARDLLVYEREIEHRDDPAGVARLRFEAGRLSEQLGDLDRARTHYREALQVDPRLTAALRGLRRIARAAADWDEVIGCLTAEIELAAGAERRALVAHRLDLLMASGDRDRVRAAVAEILADDAADLRALLAELELAFVDGRDDDFRRGLERLSEAAAGTRFGTDLTVLGARLDERGGDLDRAAVALRDLTASQPWVRPAQALLARVETRAGRFGEAAEALAGAADSQLSAADPVLASALQWRRASLARAAGDADADVAALSVARELGPDDPVVMRAAAAMADAVAASDPDDEGNARAAADEWLRLAEVTADPSQRAGAHRRAAAWLAVAAPDQAAAALAGAVEADPADAVAAWELRTMLAVAGRERLDELDRRAVAADPAGTLRQRVLLAQRLLAAGEDEAAIVELRAAGAAGERNPNVVRALLEALDQADRRAERAELLDELARAEVELVEAPVMQRWAASAAEARAYDTVDRLTRARVEAESEEGGATEGADARLQALAAAREAALVAALEAWQRVLDHDERTPGAHAAAQRLAALLGNADILDDVLARAQRAADEPSEAVTLALHRMALVLAQEEPDPDRAIDLLREALANEPTDPRVALALFCLLAGTGRWLESAAVLEERAIALGEGPEADALRYRAAAVFLDQADEPARAVELLTGVVERRPQLDAAAELLQRAHRRLGDPGALAADLERGAKPRASAGVTTADAFANLVREAELYEGEVGDPARAVELYGRALELRPHDPLARDGFTRAAAAAGETAALADLALRDLKDAEERGDAAGKADAYEELARIDEELRGDPASALLGWESAAAADPGRLGALRRLERAYLEDGRNGELLDLYARLIQALGDGGEGVALLRERARRAEAEGRALDEILADYRQAFERDRSARMPLFQLEAHARQAGASRELSELEVAVADYFQGDARARAAFLTRAGETLLALGDIEPSLERFKQAADEVPGYAPALGGWRTAAMSGQLWLDLAEAAEREAQAAAVDADRAALHHLAGVALMDKALAGERAVGALRRALAAEPAHRDAFVRLRLLFDEQGQHEDLAQLLAQRLEVEADPRGRVELHAALAELHRNFLDDRDGALAHLRALLELDPRNLAAVAAVSDILWEKGAWAEAAEALIARARLEQDAGVLKHIFYRLGTIYADRLPDKRWALKSFQKVLTYDPNDLGALTRLAALATETGDWGMALGACERRLKLAERVEDKVACLHQVAVIYRDGLKDAARAERALRAALDLDPTSADALDALIGYYRDAGDVRSMRVHLDRVAAPMRARLEQSPLDGIAYRVLARTLEAREQTGVKGSLATARCAAELALLAGAGAEPEERLAAPIARVRPIIQGLGDGDIDDALYPRSVPSGLRQVFGVLGDRIGKHLGADLRRWGVGRGERVRRPDDPLLQVVRDVAEEMGVPQVDLYVSSEHPLAIAIEPTAPLSLVLGKDLAVGERPDEVRFAVGRALKLGRSSLWMVDRFDPDELGMFLVALLRQFAPEFLPAGFEPAAVEAETQKLRKLVPNNLLQELRPFAVGVAGAQFNHKRIWTGVHQAGNRAGLLASGSPRAAVAVLSRRAGYEDLARAATDAQIAELMRFAVSDDHAQLRSLLGA